LKDTVARAIKRTVSLTGNDEENKEDLNAEQTMILSGFYINAAKLPPDPTTGHINPERLGEIACPGRQYDRGHHHT
jgi:hypothetical protein